MKRLIRQAKPYDPNWAVKEKAKWQKKRQEQNALLNFPLKVEELKQKVDDSGLVGERIKSSGLDFDDFLTQWEVPNLDKKLSMSFNFSGINENKNKQWIASIGEMSVSGPMSVDPISQISNLLKLYRNNS